MALTLQERVNCLKGYSEDQWSSISVTPMEKLEVAMQKIAGDLVEGTLTPASLPNYTLYNPSNAQLNEWCSRVLDNLGIINRMKPSIISQGQWDTDGAAINDAPIRNTCLNVVCSYAAKL